MCVWVCVCVYALEFALVCARILLAWLGPDKLYGLGYTFGCVSACVYLASK